MGYIFKRFVGLVCLVTLLLVGVSLVDIYGPDGPTPLGTSKPESTDSANSPDASDAVPPLPPPSMLLPDQADRQGTQPNPNDTPLLPDTTARQGALLPAVQPDSAASATGDISLAPGPQVAPPTEVSPIDAAKGAGGSAPDSVPDSAEIVDAAEAPDDTIKGTINKGDTVGKLLSEVADNNMVQDYIDATRRVFPLTAFRAGQPYVLVYDPVNGGVKRFEYEIDTKRRLVVEGEQPAARVEVIEYDTRLVHVQARIDANLFQSVADIGESPNLAITLANLFGWEINFIRDLQEGDSFNVLVEKLYREGKFRGYGRVLGATFTNKGKTYEAFLFHNGESSTQHFNAKGENLKKVLLQSPLSFTRLTSRFTHSRKHPIYGDRRPHLGVDYGAPTGTPVKAVGEGTVTIRGWVGGYGNQVVLRHAAGLESMYSHLSGFARGLQKGTKVRQGQVIAYVGSTGQSTGPHLDFRLKQHNKFIDPTKAVNPRSASVYSKYATAFAQRKTLVREYFEGIRPLQDYDTAMISSPAVAREAESSSDEAAKSNKSSRSRSQRR